MELKIGGKVLSIEEGKIANAADSSCTVRYGDTVVLVTVCRQWEEPATPLSFFPLTCDYLERRYAAGRIPGGFFKREGRPTEKEIISSRLIDRPVRPLFPAELKTPVQVIGTVLSSDQENDADILAIIGASYALRTSSLPFLRPIGAVRIGMIGSDFIVNPTMSELENASLNLVAAGTSRGITMLEAKSKEVKEEDILKSLELAQTEIQKIIKFQESVKEGSKSWEPHKLSSELKDLIKNKFGAQIEEALKIKERNIRWKKLYDIQSALKNEVEEKYPEQELTAGFEEVECNYLRNELLKNKIRLGGRGPRDLRPISCEVGILPRAHGSGLFTRGETQSLCTITLGTVVDEQKIEELMGESYKSFMVHYNFPPFSVGEVKQLRGPGRREIGHGVLAEKALESIIPSSESFPYTIRLVSDILSSNGSSSMATVCGGSLALMDAGIPIKSHVAGVALGLIGDEILVDIAGEEDHFGDMDFKVAGTNEGITAIQLDVKAGGLKIEILEKALKFGKEARFFILEQMNSTISKPKKEISSYAPKLKLIQIPKEKIGQVIGPGGKIIREITEKTGAKIEISDEGKVTISSDSWETTETAQKIIEGIVKDVEVGKTYIGKVTKIMPFGAFVEILPGKEGLIHISQLARHRVEKTEDEIKVGEKVPCKVIGIEQGKIQLSRKALLH
ncbi:polyribonucleotide nucleotidyltransferase [candidate division WOR-3 bacterium]|nr:polyribonucleotide nucleotidyltransferase [candidate division WOR-3 bacterium]